jgi:VanZ family protein
LVYASIGKEYFTFAVLFVVISGLLATLYFLIFKFRVKNVSQYIWLVISCSIYIYFTFQLKKHPEEAVHLIEYSLLTYFIFKALSYRIRDWTVYITPILLVAFAGTIDEFIQWLLPSRVWDYKDIRLNTLSAAIFTLIVWKVIRPAKICQPVQKISLRTLLGIITVNLIFLGLCLSNTPEIVNMYTAQFNGLSWLQNEEAMTKHGAVPVSLRTIWLIIAAILAFLWTFGRRWERRLDT